MLKITTSVKRLIQTILISTALTSCVVFTALAADGDAISVSAKKQPAQLSVLKAPFPGILSDLATPGTQINAGTSVVANVRSTEVQGALGALRGERLEIEDALRWGYGIQDFDPQSQALGSAPADGNQNTCAPDERIEPLTFVDAFGRSFEVNDPILTYLTVEVVHQDDAVNVCAQIAQHWKRALRRGPTKKDILFLDSFDEASTAPAKFSTCTLQPHDRYGSKISYLLDRCEVKLAMETAKQEQLEAAQDFIAQLIDRRYLGQPIFPVGSDILERARRELSGEPDEFIESVVTRTVMVWRAAAEWATKECTERANQEAKARNDLLRATDSSLGPAEHIEIAWCSQDKARKDAFFKELRSQQREFTFSIVEHFRIQAPNIWRLPTRGVLPSPPPSGNAFSAPLTGLHAERSRTASTLTSMDWLTPYRDGVDVLKNALELSQIRSGFMQAVAQYQTQWLARSELISSQLRKLEAYYDTGNLVSPYDGVLLQIYEKDGATVSLGQPIAGLRLAGTTLQLTGGIEKQLPLVTGLPVWLCGLESQGPTRGFLTHNADMSLITVSNDPATVPEVWEGTLYLHPVQKCAGMAASLAPH